MTNPKVDFYFNKATKWQEELEKLRTIILATDLKEELKWGVPCYINEKGNIVLIHDFKEYCAVLFFKGALLKDPENILIQQTENVQSARQIRFTSLEEIKKRESILKTYIFEAVEVEKAGLKVELKKSTDLKFPEEFQKVLDNMPEVKTAFEALTPGRQRAYNLFFTATKQAKAREARIEKSIPQIMEGRGLNEE